MKKSRALVISAAVLALLVALYALAGFVLLPRYVLKEAPNWLAGSGHRLGIREFRFNPFTLDAAAGGVTIEDAAGKPVFAAASASVDAEWMSLVRRAPVLASVQVTQPALNVEIDEQGRVNLARFSQDDGQPSTGTPRFYIGSLILSEGRIDFADRRENYSTRFEQLSLKLSALSTLEAGAGTYALTAETPQGAKLDWQGDMSMQPITVSGRLAVTGVALPALWPYLDQWLAAPPVSGQAELQLPHRFLIHEGRPQLLLDGASAKLTDLALRGPQAGAQSAGADKTAVPKPPAASPAASPTTLVSPSLKLGTLALSGIKLDLLAQALSAELLQMNGLDVALRRNANGLDIAQLLRTGAPQAGPAATAPAKASADKASGAQKGKDWAVNVARTELRQGSVQLHDQLKSVALGLDALGGHIDNLALGGSQDMPFELQAKLSSGGQLQWQGGLTLEPLGVAGKLALEAIALPPLSPYLDEVLAVPLTSGQADAELPHRFALQDGKPRLTLQEASATLTKVALGEGASEGQAQAGQAPGLAFDSFSARGVSLDLDGHSAGAKLLSVSKLGTALHREADGTLNLSRLVKTAQAGPAQRAPAAAAKAATPAAAAPRSEPGWTIDIARAELADSTLAFTDAASGISVTLEKLGARVEAYSSRGKAVAFDVAAGLRGGGQLGMKGRLTPPGDAPFALSGRVEATNLPVALLQPMVGQNYRLKLASGEATLAGDLQVGGKDAQVRYTGSLSVNNVSVNEAALKPAAGGEGARLLGWKSFGTDKLTLTLSPDRLDMDELRLVAPVGQLAIAPDRSINFGRAFRPAEPAAEEKAADKPAPAEPATAAAPAKTAPADEPGGFAFDIRRLRVSDGKLDFSDRSLALDFSIAIQELGGVFNGLSSDRDSRSQFNLEGKVGEFGFARLTGGLNPYGWRDNTTLRAEFRNVDLQKVSPYSVTFAGYSIASGRLSLDLRYRINNSLVEGDNHAVFDQLTLGPKTESPRAMDLPIEMAISLLKDDNGRIDIAIPVTGSLDDPQFNYGELIRKAIGTVISRIVTAPFRALASLFGGGSKGEEAGNISFEPGQSRLLPPEREKLQRVAQGLEKRPELKVVIPGRADGPLDSARLRREALTREIAKRSGFDVAEDESAGGVSIADARTRTAIRELYAERFGKAELDKQREQAETQAAKAEAGKPGVLDRLKNLASGEPQVTNPRPFYGALMRRLRENQPLPQDALEQLAQARAQSIADALKQSGVAESRITTSTVATTADAQAKEITVELSLAKR